MAAPENTGCHQEHLRDKNTKWQRRYRVDHPLKKDQLRRNLNGRLTHTLTGLSFWIAQV